jgi:hypothetical protein
MPDRRLHGTLENINFSRFTAAKGKIKSSKSKDCRKRQIEKLSKETKDYRRKWKMFQGRFSKYGNSC